ncbi:MAG: hypothetical protein AB8B55_01835 [Mariniblastus sp.]
MNRVPRLLSSDQDIKNFNAVVLAIAFFLWVFETTVVTRQWSAM